MEETQSIGKMTGGAGGERRRVGLGRRTAFRLAFAAVLVLAFVLRFYGLDWDRGFPYTPHPDERAILFRVQDLSPPDLSDLGLLLDADESPWNPGWFNYGSFPLYLLLGVDGVTSALGDGATTDLRVPGRALSALADVFTVALVFALGRLAYGRRTALLASAMTAVAVIHIQLSHFFAVDTLQALLAVAALYFMYRTAMEGRLRDSVLAGAFVGLGLATKPSQAPIYGALVVAHLMYATSLNGRGNSTTDRPPEARGGSAAKALGISLVVSAAVFFVAQPYAFLDWSKFISDVTEQSEMVRRIRDYPYTRQYVDTTPYWYHVKQLATWGLGLPLGVVAWTGLIYASVRGMRPVEGLAYLAIGWGLPIAILLSTDGFAGMAAASLLALAALVTTLPLRSRRSRGAVVLLAWVVPYFLITGAFDVKFMRYLLPITPFLFLFGSRMLVDLWDRLTARREAYKSWLVGGLVVVLGFTGFYAISYLNVFDTRHTAARASDWIRANAPEGSLVLKEHWDEGLPYLGSYRVAELPLYDSDTKAKFLGISEQLAEADYLVFFSNRLYGTIPRLPERYDVSGDYYRLLLAGELGYELVDFEATYPELMGVSFVDDTFGRPDVPEPAALASFRPSPVSLSMGFADESFSVYDHPKVLILQNTGRYSANEIFRALYPVPQFTEFSSVTVTATHVGLLLSEEDAAAQRSGGTWTDIVRPESWTARLPVVGWLVVVQGIGLLTLPIAFVVFRPLADRGYLLAKPLGLLSVGLVVWLLASLQWVPFSRGSISLAVALLAAVSAVAVAKRRREMADFVRTRWRTLATGEALFMVAFFAFLALRMANPDLWHPFRGGEKPMDLAYLNAVLRSSYMPPYDPWYAGGYINYYYWGQFLVGTLVRATGIAPTVAYNLAVPMFFALTAGAAFTIVYNLAEVTRRRLTLAGSERPGPAWSPIVAGLAGAVFVVVLGNLDGAIQVGQGATRALFLDQPFGQFDFWRSSRMMPPDPPGFEITEFPFFTFLFADLHAHLMALPFTLLALGLSLAQVLGATRTPRPGVWNAESLLRLTVLGVTVGALRVINAWDYPTYLIVGAAAVLLAEYFAAGGLGLGVLVRAGVKALWVFGVGYLAFLPYHLSYETFFASLETTTNTTALWQFLAIGGLFIFIVGSFTLRESTDVLRYAGGSLRGAVLRLVRALNSDGAAEETHGSGAGVGLVIGLAALALGIGLIITAALTGVVGSTIPFAAVMLALLVIAGLRWLRSDRPDGSPLAFVAVLAGMSLALVIGLDVWRVDGDIDRMNSVFKFYLQVWVMLALASAYLLWHMAQGRRVPLWRLAPAKMAWVGMLTVLLLSTAVYPVMGTQVRLRDRFDADATRLTLDGTAYVEDTVYRDQKGDIPLDSDFDGIRWLQDNIEGSPVVLEGVTPTYRWGSRVSIYTGLPTVAGWQWHQQQQRWDYRSSVDLRIADVKRIYSTTDAREAADLLRRYDVEYVYLGELERLYYPGPGLQKFDGSMEQSFQRVYDNGESAIYRVVD